MPIFTCKFRKNDDFIFMKERFFVYENKETKKSVEKKEEEVKVFSPQSIIDQYRKLCKESASNRTKLKLGELIKKAAKNASLRRWEAAAEIVIARKEIGEAALLEMLEGMKAVHMIRQEYINKVQTLGAKSAEVIHKISNNIEIRSIDIMVDPNKQKESVEHLLIPSTMLVMAEIYDHYDRKGSIPPLEKLEDFKSMKISPEVVAKMDEYRIEAFRKHQEIANTPSSPFHKLFFKGGENQLYREVVKRDYHRSKILLDLDNVPAASPSTVKALGANFLAMLNGNPLVFCLGTLLVMGGAIKLAGWLFGKDDEFGKKLKKGAFGIGVIFILATLFGPKAVEWFKKHYGKDFLSDVMDYKDKMIQAGKKAGKGMADTVRGGLEGQRKELLEKWRTERLKQKAKRYSKDLKKISRDAGEEKTISPEKLFYSLGYTIPEIDNMEIKQEDVSHAKDMLVVMEDMRDILDLPEPVKPGEPETGKTIADGIKYEESEKKWTIDAICKAITRKYGKGFVRRKLEEMNEKNFKKTMEEGRSGWGERVSAMEYLYARHHAKAIRMHFGFRMSPTSVALMSRYTTSEILGGKMHPSDQKRSQYERIQRFLKEKFLAKTLASGTKNYLDDLGFDENKQFGYVLQKFASKYKKERSLTELWTGGKELRYLKQLKLRLKRDEYTLFKSYTIKELINEEIKPQHTSHRRVFTGVARFMKKLWQTPVPMYDNKSLKEQMKANGITEATSFGEFVKKMMELHPDGILKKNEIERRAELRRAGKVLADYITYEDSNGHPEMYGEYASAQLDPDFIYYLMEKKVKNIEAWGGLGGSAASLKTNIRDIVQAIKRDNEGDLDDRAIAPYVDQYQMLVRFLRRGAIQAFIMEKPELNANLTLYTLVTALEKHKMLKKGGIPRFSTQITRAKQEKDEKDFDSRTNRLLNEMRKKTGKNTELISKEKEIKVERAKALLACVQTTLSTKQARGLESIWIKLNAAAENMPQQILKDHPGICKFLGISDFTLPHAKDAKQYEHLNFVGLLAVKMRADDHQNLKIVLDQLAGFTLHSLGDTIEELSQWPASLQKLIEKIQNEDDPDKLEKYIADLKDLELKYYKNVEKVIEERNKKETLDQANVFNTGPEALEDAWQIVTLWYTWFADIIPLRTFIEENIVSRHGKYRPIHQAVYFTTSYGIYRIIIKPTAKAAFGKGLKGVKGGTSSIASELIGKPLYGNAKLLVRYYHNPYHVYNLWLNGKLGGPEALARLNRAKEIFEGSKPTGFFSKSGYSKFSTTKGRGVRIPLFSRLAEECPFINKHLWKSHTWEEMYLSIQKGEPLPGYKATPKTPPVSDAVPPKSGKVPVDTGKAKTAKTGKETKGTAAETKKVPVETGTATKTVPVEVSKVNPRINEFKNTLRPAMEKAHPALKQVDFTDDLIQRMVADDDFYTKLKNGSYSIDELGDFLRRNGAKIKPQEYKIQVGVRTGGKFKLYAKGKLYSLELMDYLSDQKNVRQFEGMLKKMRWFQDTEAAQEFIKTLDQSTDLLRDLKAGAIQPATLFENLTKLEVDSFMKIARVDYTAFRALSTLDGTVKSRFLSSAGLTTSYLDNLSRFKGLSVKSTMQTTDSVLRATKVVELMRSPEFIARLAESRRFIHTPALRFSNGLAAQTVVRGWNLISPLQTEAQLYKRMLWGGRASRAFGYGFVALDAYIAKTQYDQIVQAYDLEDVVFKTPTKDMEAYKIKKLEEARKALGQEVTARWVAVGFSSVSAGVQTYALMCKSASFGGPIILGFAIISIGASTHADVKRTEFFDLMPAETWSVYAKKYGDMARIQKMIELPTDNLSTSEYFDSLFSGGGAIGNLPFLGKMSVPWGGGISYREMFHDYVNTKVKAHENRFQEQLESILTDTLYQEFGTDPQLQSYLTKYDENREEYMSLFTEQMRQKTQTGAWNGLLLLKKEMSKPSFTSFSSDQNVKIRMISGLLGNTPQQVESLLKSKSLAQIEASFKESKLKEETISKKLNELGPKLNNPQIDPQRKKHFIALANTYLKRAMPAAKDTFFKARDGESEGDCLQRVSKFIAQSMREAMVFAKFSIYQEYAVKAKKDFSSMEPHEQKFYKMLVGVKANEDLSYKMQIGGEKTGLIQVSLLNFETQFNKDPKAFAARYYETMQILAKEQFTKTSAPLLSSLETLLDDEIRYLIRDLRHVLHLAKENKLKFLDGKDISKYSYLLDPKIVAAGKGTKEAVAKAIVERASYLLNVLSVYYMTVRGGNLRDTFVPQGTKLDKDVFEVLFTRVNEVLGVGHQKTQVSILHGFVKQYAKSQKENEWFTLERDPLAASLQTPQTQDLEGVGFWSKELFSKEQVSYMVNLAQEFEFMKKGEKLFFRHKRYASFAKPREFKESVDLLKFPTIKEEFYKKKDKFWNKEMVSGKEVYYHAEKDLFCMLYQGPTGAWGMNVIDNPKSIEDPAVRRDYLEKVHMDTKPPVYATWLTFFKNNSHQWIDVDAWSTKNTDKISKQLISYLPADYQSHVKIFATSKNGRIDSPLLVIRKGVDITVYDPIAQKEVSEVPASIQMLSDPQFQGKWGDLAKFKEFKKLPDTKTLKLDRATVVNDYVFAYASKGSQNLFTIENGNWMPISNLDNYIKRNASTKWFFDELEKPTTKPLPESKGEDPVILRHQFLTQLKKDPDFASTWVNGGNGKASGKLLASISTKWGAIKSTERASFFKDVSTGKALAFDVSPEVRVMNGDIYLRQTQHPLQWLKMKNETNGEFEPVPIFLALKMTIQLDPQRFKDGGKLTQFERADILAHNAKYGDLVQGKFSIEKGKVQCNVTPEIAKPTPEEIARKKEVIARAKELLAEQKRQNEIERKEIEAQLASPAAKDFRPGKVARLKAQLYIKKAYASTVAEQITNIKQYIEEAKKNKETRIVTLLNIHLEALGTPESAKPQPEVVKKPKEKLLELVDPARGVWKPITL